MSHDIDKHFFQLLAEMDPEKVCKRVLCSYDSIKKCFTIPAWGSVFEIIPESAEIIDSSRANVNKNTGLPVLFYILKAKDILLAGEWISEKDIPGGVAFYTGPHAIPSSLVVEKVNNNIDMFTKACKVLGGDENQMGDASFCFRILPRIPVTVVYWLGDDEFKPEVKILFDRTIGEHLPLDVIFVLIVELLTRISGLCS